MDEAKNNQDLSQDLTPGNLDAPTFDDYTPDAEEMEALDAIDLEGLAAAEVAGLALDMMELEPTLSAESEHSETPEQSAKPEPSAELEQTTDALPDAQQVPAPEPVAAGSAAETAAPDSPKSSPEESESSSAASEPTPTVAASEPAGNGEPEKERERISHIVFRIDEKRYAVEMQRLLELDRMTPVTPVPHTPEFILGVTNLRGEIVSVIDLRRLFGMEPMDRPETGRLLKLRDRRHLLVSGVLVDAIQGARTIKPEQIRPANRSVGSKIAPLLEGVCDDGGEEVNVLDVDKLFESEQVRALTGA